MENSQKICTTFCYHLFTTYKIPLRNTNKGCTQPISTTYASMFNMDLGKEEWIHECIRRSQKVMIGLEDANNRLVFYALKLYVTKGLSVSYLHGIKQSNHNMSVIFTL